VTVASIPSPSTAVWHLGALPIRAYALCIVLGIIVACYVMDRRMRARGAPPYAVLDVAVWAVPFGIVGARIYHVITSPQAYFGDGGHPLDALKIWEGGLGVWGSVAGGAVGAWLAARQMGLPLTFLADTLAPGLALAQAVGRLGNWFNNELYGRQTSLPWGLKVHDMDPNDPGKALVDADGNPVLKAGTFHPTFLYELIWDVGVAGLVWLVDRKYKLGRGRAFALYAMAYTAGRAWIEALRVDEANHFLGVRLNVWTALVVFVAALIYFLRVRGPQEFLVPTGAQGKGAPGGAGYRVVSEQEYRRYQETGELPEAVRTSPEHEPGEAGSAAGAAPDDTGSGPTGADEGTGPTGAGATGAGAGGDATGDGEDGTGAGAPKPAAKAPDQREPEAAEASTADDR
jgi:prolipoprotein diacylglyceryl transferase